uniref:Putative ovule protein n=1 Tax=Solanum chacoense TaxID=4108 RepID=A0A0V0GL63_SOLCH
MCSYRAWSASPNLGLTHNLVIVTLIVLLHQTQTSGYWKPNLVYSFHKAISFIRVLTTGFYLDTFIYSSSENLVNKHAHFIMSIIWTSPLETKKLQSNCYQ